MREADWMKGAIQVAEGGRVSADGWEDLLKYHGVGSPGGVAIAFKALERALQLLDPQAPCERREIVIATAFGGPGARDAFEMVTRAVTGDRFRVDPELELADRVMARPATEVFAAG
jgi:hypothetical protein